MRLVLLLCLLLTFPVSDAAQRKRSANKPKTNPSKKEMTPCGMYLSLDGLLEEVEERWRKATESRENNYFYDTHGACDSKTGIYKTWVKVVPKDPNARPSKTMQLFEFKCRVRQSRILSTTEYAPNGDVTESYIYKTPQWVDVIPDSIGEGLLLTVCHLN